MFMRFNLPTFMMLMMAFAIVPARAQMLQSSVDDQALAQRAVVIKPAPRELRWQAIPWIVDLNEGWRTAQAERRPLFLWASGDDPLERC
jgi:hypothetical protein